MTSKNASIKAIPSATFVLPVLLFAMISLASVTTVFGQSKCKFGQFQETYYSNLEFKGAATITRCSSVINHVWSDGDGPSFGSSSSDPKADGFSSKLKTRYSVNFVGNFRFGGGTYTFHAKADDGVRVWVGDTLLIDQWNDHAPTEFSQSIDLSPGDYKVTVQYYQNGGEAVIHVWWDPRQ